jgi:hypothetical protein
MWWCISVIPALKFEAARTHNKSQSQKTSKKTQPKSYPPPKKKTKEKINYIHIKYIVLKN